MLRGNLAPGGAVIKHSAASPRLLAHTGSAVVFDSLEDLAARVDDPDLDVAPEDVLVLRGAGPKGAPGMPEAGYIPIPKKLAARGVKDMVRLSDARMSGTAFGTIVLHVTPESRHRGTARPRRDRRPDPARRRLAASRPAGAGRGDRGRRREAMGAAPGPPGVGARLPPPLPRHRDRSRPRLRLRLHGPSRRVRFARPCRPAGARSMIHRSNGDAAGSPSA